MTTKDEALRVAREALENIIQATHSHVDGRDLLAELHPRYMLDIKRRVDGRETWFEGDWLSTLWQEVKAARSALRTIALAGEAPSPGAPGDTDAERAAWLADKIVVYGGYAKEAAQMLRRWPAASLRIAGADGATSNGQENGNGR